MPSPGLQIFGAGLRLQQATPGVTDNGNANILGTMYAGIFRTKFVGGGGPTTSFMAGSFTLGGSDINNQTSAVCIGENQVLGALGGNIVIGRQASSGNGGVSSAQNGVIIGFNAVWAGGYGTATGGVCIGSNSQFSNANQTVIGQSANGGANSQTTVIGASAEASQAGNISIGYAARDNGRTNCINIGAPAPSANDSINIGQLTQTNVRVGAYTITGPLNRILLMTADGVVTNTAAKSSLFGTGVGNRTMFAANGASIGQTIKIQAAGRLKTDAAPPTLVISLETDTGVVMATSVATMLPSSLVDTVWEFDGMITIRTLGAGGTARAFGLFKYTDNTGDLKVVQVDQAAAVVVPTTVLQSVNIYAKFSAASVDNTVTCAVGTLQTAS